jgi:hypothetical protein
VPLNILLGLQGMAIRDFFFNWNSNITYTLFTSSMPRIAAHKTSKMLLSCTAVLSGSYDVWAGTRGTNPLKTKENLHYIQFFPHIDVETRCFALQVKRPFVFPTVRNKTDIVMYRRSAKLEALAFDSRITSHSNVIGRDTERATPSGQNSATSEMD